MYSFLKILLTWSIRVLLVSSAILILYTLFFEAFTYDRELTPKGVKFFLQLFGQYSELLVLTFTTIGIYLIVDQIDISTQSKDVRKIGDWKIRLSKSTEKLEISNPRMFNYINIKSNEIYEYLAKNKLRISSKRQLEVFFRTFLNDKIAEFEESSKGFDENNEQYSNSDISYSFNDFMSFIFDLIEPDFHYHRFLSHFKTLYMKQVKEFNNDKLILPDREGNE